MARVHTPDCGIEHPQALGALAESLLNQGTAGPGGAPFLLIDLPRGWQTLIDEADWPLVWRLPLYRDTNGYVVFSWNENGKTRRQSLHGFLMEPPKEMEVDHRNGVPLDNRRTNLRVVTPQLNQANRQRLNSNNASGVRGVYYYRWSARSPWRAQITANGQNHYLGGFATMEAAIAARRAAELRLFGESCPTPEIRAERNVDVPVGVQHGSPSAYCTYRCRCEVCRAGEATRKRAYRTRKQQEAQAAS